VSLGCSWLTVHVARIYDWSMRYDGVRGFSVSVSIQYTNLDVIQTFMQIYRSCYCGARTRPCLPIGSHYPQHLTKTHISPLTCQHLLSSNPHL
jgi:hypothetical protein